MKKTKCALAIELRESDAALDAAFKKLPDKMKWEWLIYACENSPVASVQRALAMVGQ